MGIPTVAAVLALGAGCSGSDPGSTSGGGAGGAAGATGAGGIASGGGGSGAAAAGTGAGGGATIGTGGTATGAGGTATGAGGTATGAGGTATGVGGTATGAGGTATGAGGTATGAGGAGDAGTGSPTYAEVQGWVDAYAKAHPGRAGDINALTDAQVAADPAAQQLLSLCGKNERPVIPRLAWEYGGTDHAWINAQASALVYCVPVPINPSSSTWQYDATADHVAVDMYVLFPDQNPCKGETGANQVASCIGDPTNFEIFVDTASLHDGADAGYSLANSTTEVQLVLSDGSKVHLYNN